MLGRALTPSMIVLTLASIAAAESFDEAIGEDHDYLGRSSSTSHANPEVSMQDLETSDRLARGLEIAGFEVTRAFSDGLMYSSADTVRFIVHGIGAHGASPHQVKDPIGSPALGYGGGISGCKA